MPLREREAGVTTGNLWVSIWQISWPILLMTVLNFFVGFVDVYVAGFIGPEVQAAVGFVSQLYFLTIIVANAISIGTIALVARAIGAGDRQRAGSVAKQSLIFGILVACAMTIPGVLFPDTIVALAGFPPGIRSIAERFLRFFAVALSANYVLIISNAVFRASGEVKKPLITMAIVALVNAVGDFVLVFGVPPLPALGYLGIAIATASSVIAGMIVSLVLFFRSEWRPILAPPWRLVWEIIGRVAQLGWPAALLQIAWNAGTIVLYTLLGKLGEASVTALASLTNGLRIEAVIFLPAFALNMAASVLVGQSLGAGNVERAERLGWRIAKTGIVVMSSMALVVFVFAKQLAGLLTQDPAVLQETVRYLRITMFSEPFMALSVVLGGGLQGAGDTRGTMGVVVTAMWLIRLPLAYVLALGLSYGATGVWVAMITSMAVQGILMAQRFHGGRWKHIQME